MKPIALQQQPITVIGFKKEEPIKPITNLLQGVRAIGLEAQVVVNIYTYKKNNNLLTYFPIYPRASNFTPILRARVCEGKIG